MTSGKFQHQTAPATTHEFHETCHFVTSYFMKKTPNDAGTPQRQGQFTPKMKANAVLWCELTCAINVHVTE